MRRLLWIFLILICTGCTLEKNNYSTISEEQERNNVITSITSNGDFDDLFLEYVYDNYGIEPLNKVNEILNSNNYTDKVWHKVTGKSLNVLKDNYNNVGDDNTKVLDRKDNFSIGFVGDISLADNFDIMPHYDSRGEGISGILDSDVVDYMKSFDIMTANNEFTISNRGKKINKTYTFRANTNRTKIYHEMGVDIVSLANNHIYDYGSEAFSDTLVSLKENNIAYVGAGENINEAKKAYYYIINGYKVAFISSTRAEKNIITPEATDTTSGVFRCYDPTELIKTIKKEKERSDYVILLIHWGKEDSHELEEVQITTSKLYIDAGADAIIGSHAHTLQGIEIYNNKLIAYNLGDFIFNRETKDTGILSINFDNIGNMTYQFIPCKQDNFKTSLLTGSEKQRVINKIQSYSTNVTFDNEGTINLK